MEKKMEVEVEARVMGACIVGLLQSLHDPKYQFDWEPGSSSILRSCRLVATIRKDVAPASNKVREFDLDWNGAE